MDVDKKLIRNRLELNTINKYIHCLMLSLKLGIKITMKCNSNTVPELGKPGSQVKKG